MALVIVRCGEMLEEALNRQGIDRTMFEGLLVIEGRDAPPSSTATIVSFLGWRKRVTTRP